MEEINAMTSKSSELCFKKDDFVAENFSVDKFVSEYRKHTSLETLKEDLGLFLKILQSAMIELINKDYADFVNLSTTLVGLDKSIRNLSVPLMIVKEKSEAMQSKLDDTLSFFQAALQERDDIHKKKTMLQHLISIVESAENIEKQNVSDTLNDNLLSCEQMERIAVECNRMQFHLSQNLNSEIVQEKQVLKNKMLDILLHNLECTFLQSIDSKDSEKLYKVLRMYSIIDRVKEVENKFRVQVVRSYMRKVIDEDEVCKEGIEYMYSCILNFIPTKCTELINITRGGGIRDIEIIKGYDFLVNAVWPEIVLCLEYISPVIFAPGNPALFHFNYSVSMMFLDRFEHSCIVQSSVKRLREHSAYKTFIEKWNLDVYFEIRFQEIGGSFEESLMSPFEQPADNTPYLINVTFALWKSLNQAWDSNVFLSPISYKFWKLTLQLLSRFYIWAKDIVKTTPESTNHEAAYKTTTNEELIHLVKLVHDLEFLIMDIPPFVMQNITSMISLNCNIANEAITQNIILFKELPNEIGIIIVKHLSTECCQPLKLIMDIPRLYRKTNRDVPSKPSGYVHLVFNPLETFLITCEQFLISNWREKWIADIIDYVTQQWLSMATNVVTSVKKMEDSLKRLKKARDKPVGQSLSGIMSDDDKIRHQLHIDVDYLGDIMEKHKVDKENCNYQKLKALVTAAMKVSTNT